MDLLTQIFKNIYMRNCLNIPDTRQVFVNCTTFPKPRDCTKMETGEMCLNSYKAWLN